MSNILVNNNFYISTSSACIVDLTPPSFSGINFIDVESRGQIRVGWPAATDATVPIRYEVYVQAATATGLFNTTNIVAITPNLQFDIFSLPDGSLLENGQTYFVGIRAIDGVSNRDSNTVSLSVISTGILTSIDVYECDGAFSLAKGGNFQGTIWARKNSELVTSLNADLGTASYQVYDNDGNPIVGMSETGIVADSEGQFKITPVVSQLSETLNHYLVKVTVNIDSEDRNNYLPIVKKIPSYRVNGHNVLDSDDNFIGIFWAEDETNLHVSDLSRLGTGSYDVLDKEGNIILGFSESGITPNSQGVFKITPVPGVDIEDLNLATGRFSVEVDGVTRTTYIPVSVKKIEYKIKAQFAINALNEFMSMFWVESSLGTIKTTNLSTASYQVYDKNGNTVVGLSGSGISADSNGRFISVPVSAALLTDLTHYNVEINITVDGKQLTAYKGFSLLGN